MAASAPSVAEVTVLCSAGYPMGVGTGPPDRGPTEGEITMSSTFGVTAAREPRACPASDGWRWIREAFALVGARPGFWIGSFLLVFVVFFALALVPFVGQLATMFVGPFVIAGYANAARRQANGADPAIDQLLIGFRERAGTLVAVALLYLGGAIVIVFAMIAVLFAILGTGMLAGGGELDPALLAESWPLFAVVWLLTLALLVPLIMAYWFAPALVVFDGLDAISAMKASFFGCLRNILPFLVYALALVPIAIIAALPLFLGYLVVVPMILATYYTAWRGVFGER